MSHPDIHVISPSHFHIDNLCRLPFLPTLRALHNVALHAYMGMPLFHALVPWTLNNLRGGPSRVYCMIPDYRFGNYAYAEPSLAVPRTLNVSRSLCNSEVDGIMTDHTLAALSGLTREVRIFNNHPLTSTPLPPTSPPPPPRPAVSRRAIPALGCDGSDVVVREGL